MSTFVSIGNRTEPFARLLDMVVKIAPQLPQPVVVQHGRTPFSSDAIEHFDFTDDIGFQERLQACTLFIAHGGGASVFAAIRAGKKPVVVPRLKRFGEIVDDHQVAFAEELERQGKIIVVEDIDDLLDATQKQQAAPLLPPDSQGNATAIEAVRRALVSFAPKAEDPVLLVTPSGGHLAEIRALAPTYADRPHHFVINVPIKQSADMVGRTTIVTVSERDWKFLLNIKEAFDILRREKPRVIVTTGGGFSVAFTLVGNLLGIPTVYIETVGKVVVSTMTGRVQRFLAKRVFYQWPYLAPAFPRGEYIGVII